MKRFVFILWSLISLTAVQAQGIKITHGPYLCDMTPDGVTVVWTTNKPALSWVELAPDNKKSFYNSEHSKFYETLAGRRLAYKTLHRIRLSNLQPETGYCYRIFSKEVTEWQKNDNVIYGKTVASDVYRKKPFVFKTYPTSGDKASFIVLNDIHGRSDYMKELFKNVDFKQLDFVVFNGDMANSLESEEQIFNDYIDASVEMFASEIPVIYARGNHETRGVFADRLIDYFPTRDGKYYQLYKIGNICLLVLDGGEDKPDSDIEYGDLADYDSYRKEETVWLKSITESEDFKNAAKRIVLLHIPPSKGDWHGNEQLRKYFVPILNNANIDVMFSGHMHKYSFHEGDMNINFPILVNDNMSYLKCDVTTEKIHVNVIGTNEKIIKSHEFKK